jgi:hypothetical protein
VSREESGPELESFSADAASLLTLLPCTLLHAVRVSCACSQHSLSLQRARRARRRDAPHPAAAAAAPQVRPAAARTLTTHDIAASVFSSPATSASIRGIVSILDFWSTLSSLPSAA